MLGATPRDRVRQEAGFVTSRLQLVSSRTQGAGGTADAVHELMQPISTSELATVVGGESFGQVIRAARSAPDVSIGQTYGATTDFIANHPFFHQGAMDLPIGGGKHFRNVPFVGPGRIIGGVATGNRDAIAKGVEVTRATWDAP